MNQFHNFLGTSLLMISAATATANSSFESDAAKRFGTVSIIARKEPGAGKIEIQIDGQSRATADLSTTGARQAQQRVWEVGGLADGKHTIAIINRGPGPVAVDALIVRENSRS